MKDILDLCRLNLMEERVRETPAIDKDVMLRAIDITKRKIVMQMKPSPVAPGAMDRHRAENAAEDGVYPWTESPLYCSREEITPNAPADRPEGARSDVRIQPIRAKGGGK